jgi:opacity protein-like surface antigen
MKLSRYTVAFAFLGCLTTHAQTYMEVGYLQVNMKANRGAGMNLEANPDMIGVLGGVDLTQNFAVEGLVGTGINKSDTTRNGVTQATPIDTKISSYYGVFGKPKAKLSDDLEIFARVGYIHGAITSSAATNSIDSTSSNWVYGAGLSYSLSPKVYLTGSVQQVSPKNDVRTKISSVTLGYRF